MTHISASQITTDLMCSQQRHFIYDLGLRIPPGIAAHTGSGVHGAAEMDLKVKMETGEDAPRGDVLDAAATKFDERLRDDGVFMSREDKPAAATIIGKAKDDSVKLAGVWYDECALEVDPVWVEQKVSFHIPELGVDMLMFIDVLERDLVMRDWKTAAKKWNQMRADEEIQPTIYRQGLIETIGKEPSMFAFDILVNNKKPVRQQLVTARTEEDWHLVIEKARIMLAKKAAGLFPPAPPGFWKCSPQYCGFWGGACPHISNRLRTLPRTQ